VTFLKLLHTVALRHQLMCCFGFHRCP